MALDLIRWDGPAPYHVVFSTRTGGASEGPFASLNLGLLTADRPEHVAENRRRLCHAVGVNPEHLAMNRQVHGSQVHRAEPGRRGVPGDGLWTDRAGVPMLKVTADCLPIALARTRGKPRLALVHAGRLGLLDGVVAAGAKAVDDEAAAVIGPGIGPCCYEVSDEIRSAFRARFGGSVVRGRNLDLWTAGELALREAGVDSVERLDLCTACHPDRFFSHRRDAGATGRQGVVGVIG